MGRSIQEMFDKFKYLLKDDAFFYGSLIVLVAVISFGLGRWSVASMVPTNAEKAQNTIQINQSAAIPVATEAQYSSTTPTVTTPLIATEPQYVGSRSGTKYHLLWCPGAKQIKEENKVFFATKEEALKAGYTPAANCKGI